jgi:anthranilate synthase/aminodeoxychorismate synthase-like glutamine amidotransferase
MILLIDNYDSFTYNLKQYIEELGSQCVVYRNDAIGLEQIATLSPRRIVISPGPGNPDSAGITLDLIRSFAGRIPILGVCLGHQAIGQAFGGKVIRAPRPKHGKISRVSHHGKGLFAGVPSPFNVARYHSLIVERESLPDCLEISAESEDGLIMGLRHRKLEVQGVQFHPESIATENGRELLGNFVGRDG